MLESHLLLTLTRVARAGSLTAAAAELDYSPSALSQQIATLERRVGAPVLQRHARGVRPTDIGAMLISYADRIGALLGDAESELRDALRGTAGTVRIGSFPTASRAIIAPAAAAYSATHPHVDLVLRECEPAEGLHRVESGELHAAVIFHYPQLGPRHLEHIDIHELCEDALLLAIPVDHPLASLAVVDVADLRTICWIHGHDWGPPTQLLQHICRQAGFNPDISYESDNYQVQQSLVAAGLGIALIPALALGPAPTGIVTRPIANQPLHRRISVATTTDPQKPAVSAFIDALTRTATD